MQEADRFYVLLHPRGNRVLMVPEPLALQLVLETLEDRPNFCDLLLCLNVIRTVRLDPFILKAGNGKPVKKENDAF